MFDDFTDDGRPDVVYRNGRALVVNPRSASGDLEPGRAYKGGTLPEGRDDIIIGGASLLYIPSTPTGFEPIQDFGECGLAEGSSPISPQSADLDGDGAKDIVALCTTRVRIALNRSATGFDVFDMPNLGAEQLFARDIDGDDRPDLLFVGRSGMWMAGTRTR